MIYLVAIVQVHNGVVHWAALSILSEAALQHVGFFGAQCLPAALLLRLQLPHHIRAAPGPVTQCYSRAATHLLLSVCQQVSNYTGLSVLQPGDADEGHLLAAAVVDQGHAHALQRQDGLLFGQLYLLALAEQLVDALLAGEQHHTLEAFIDGDHKEVTLIVDVLTQVLKDTYNRFKSFSSVCYVSTEVTHYDMI